MFDFEMEESLLNLASYLTDPICKVREYAYRAYTERDLNPRDYRVANLARGCFYALAAFVFGIIALFTTLPGGLLRGAVTHFQKRPYIEEKGVGKVMGEREFTLLSWNLCCVAGGYTITDGGVTPWEDRIGAIIQRVIEADPDVNCFYEVFDARAAKILKQGLKERGYTYFYTNIGAQALGTSSGIMVASKYEIQNPEFTPFPIESLVERTKWCAKGVFGFDLCNRGDPFARVFATHLQHSEIPEFVIEKADSEEVQRRAKEVAARQEQMRIVISKIRDVANKCILITGDLNMDDNEYGQSDWQPMFIRGNRFGSKTWNGDGFCAKLMGKRISGPLNLDHTMALMGTVRQIETTLVHTGYDSAYYSKDALSDHEGLFTRIKLNQ